MKPIDPANDTTALEQSGANLRAARETEQRARDQARQDALAAIENGATETAVARHLGVSRMTIRQWLGK